MEKLVGQAKAREIPYRSLSWTPKARLEENQSNLLPIKTEPDGSNQKLKLEYFPPAPSQAQLDTLVADPHPKRRRGRGPRPRTAFGPTQLPQPPLPPRPSASPSRALHAAKSAPTRSPLDGPQLPRWALRRPRGKPCSHTRSTLAFFTDLGGCTALYYSFFFLLYLAGRGGREAWARRDRLCPARGSSGRSSGRPRPRPRPLNPAAAVTDSHSSGWKRAVV